MIEQKYFVDQNTIEMHEPLKVLCFKIGKPTIIAKGVPPHHQEEFVMLDKVYSTDETVRKLISLRNRPSKSIGLDLSGSDFILGPNIDDSKTGIRNIILGNQDQLRVWVRNTLRRKQ